jgi:hypothetical protein
MGDYYTPGSSQEAVLVAARTGSDFFLTVFQTNWQGPVSFKGPLDEADFIQQLRLMGLSEGVQNQIASVSAGQAFVFSNLGVPENLAGTDWGMHFHDADMAEENNDVVFSRFQPVTDELIVRVLLNNRDRGFAHWHGLKKCLASYTPSPGGSAGYSPAQLDQIEAELKATGVSTLKPMNGGEGAMVNCIYENKYQPTT